MFFPVDGTRTGALLVLGKRIALGVGLIAAGSLIDLIPEKVAELSLGIGLCFMLASAVAPMSLLNRMTGAESHRRDSGSPR